jgi:putative transposase
MKSYGVAHRELMPNINHNIEQHVNNRAEQLQSLPRFMDMKRLG